MKEKNINNKKKMNNMSKKMKRDKGITLVALIITVVVMLILAGVAIAAIVDGEGLFSKTRQAAESYENAATNEATILNSLTDIMDEYMATKYVDWAFSESGLLKVIDEYGNLYVSEQAIMYEKSPYTNTGIKLVKVNDNIKVSKLISSSYYGIDGYIMDNTGKLYFFNEESNKCELLFNGKEFYLDQYYIYSAGLHILAKDGYIYDVVGSSIELNKEVEGIKFKEIKFGYGLSIDNKIYSINYGTLCSADYEVAVLGNDFFIDVNNDVYEIAFAPDKLSDGNTKFEKIFYFENDNKDYVIAQNGYVYEVFARAVNLIVPEDYKHIKGIVGDEEAILDTGYFYDNTEKNEILENMNIKIKKILYDEGWYILFIDENNDLYFLGDDINGELTCIKMNDDIKVKEFISGNLNDGIYILGTDNKVYSIFDVGTENFEFEITLCSEDKVMNHITSPFYKFPGFFGITKNGEICYSLTFKIIS